ncbi:hypothetical protein CO174_03990 [Candidatus Uhrbacteria bacterium CG_4_9_14_3_um_filter_50_9]|uniref:Uncharacterized protein n=1 Tax=Candidatus Uhrbacteria bacterium CG_4_9_14_3_um_filter_50_9 TaxID=1975035 RepID=A0A2M7XC79_9BACT|nr:MAG: hypothetical protein CO174_03990 [Candidatus Uhrbacteria bacterium CG_4_9_14_3_um_filter_50_9]
MMTTVTSASRRLSEAQGVFGDITRWVTYLLFFLIPVFFLPWTTNALDINKQMLFVILAVIGVGAWLGQMVLSKRLAFKSGWLNVVPGLFLVSLLISSILSLSGYQTWVGQASQEYTSFLSLALFILMFYMIMNNASSTQMQRHVLSALLFSASLSGLLALLGALDLWHLPFQFSESVGFNTVGTMNGLVMFLTVVMFVGLAMWLVSNQGQDRVIPQSGSGTLLRLLILFVTVSNLVLLIAIDFWLFWIINIIGVLLLGGFVFLQTQEFPQPRRFALPLVILFISILLLFLPSPVNLNLPVVVSPSYSTSWDITRSTLGAETSNLLFGSGPGTFLYDYLAYKPASVNASQFWSLRFDRAKSFVLTSLSHNGVVGTLLWVVLMGWIGLKALSRLVRERDHEEWKMTYVIFVGWTMLVVAHVLYSSNFTMQFLLWSFSGLLAAQVMLRPWQTDFIRSPKLGLATSFAFVIVAVGALASLFVTGQRYSAEVAFAKAVALDQFDAPIEEVIAQLQVAVSLNGFSDTYYRNLTSALLVQGRELISEIGGEEMTTDETQELVGIVEAAIQAAERSTQIEPNYVSNWVVRGSLYRDLMGFAQGAEDLAAQMFSNTIALEPINPTHRTNLGRVYLAVADRARALIDSEDAEFAAQAVEAEASNLAIAEQAFLSAIELKSDYLPAHYYLAATYERQGLLEQATNRLLALRNNNPTDVGLAFQLTQLLIRLEEYAAATQELERIVTLAPDYSNALWYLASMYEIAGERQAAITLLERVVELNPDNSVAKDRLARMRAGERTTAIPEPIQDGDGTAISADEGEIVHEGDVVEGEGTEPLSEDGSEEPTE